MNKNNPQRLLTGSLLFAALVLVCLSASPYRSYERARSSAVRDMRALELSGAILQLDEVLTMSARMAAVTGDLAWEKRYRKHEPELDAAIAELSTLAKGLMLQEFAQETGAANRQLVSMENSAFRLVHQGRLKEASAVMLGNNYLEQKKMYAKGLEKFLASLKEQTKGDWRRAKESSLLTTIVSLVFILILFAVWAAIVRLLRDVRRKDEKTATYLELEHVVASILAASSDPVELAPKIIEAVCSVLGWDFGAWWLIDRDCGELYCSAQWHAAGMDGGALFKEDNAAMVFKSGVGLPGRVWASGRAAWIEDVVKETWFRRLSGARQLALRGACGFPIMVNDEILGIVEFFSRKTIAPDQKILETLDSLCKQIGQRIKRMQVDSHVMQIQKMDAIGRLAGGVAHDFNNNLSCILGLCNLLMKQLPPGSGAGDDVAEIRGVAERSFRVCWVRNSA